MSVPIFADLVGDESVFFSEYFGVKPLVRRGALGTASRTLLTVGDLERLLRTESLRPPYVFMAKDGRELPARTFTRAVQVKNVEIPDSIDPDSVVRLFKAGCVVTCYSLNHLLPSMRTLAAAMTEKLGGRSEVTAFLTPAEHRGFSPHSDRLEVFAIQLHGRKRWSVWPAPPDWDGTTTSFTLEQLGDPELSVTLQPGDVMYVPYGFPHTTEAEDTMSLHVSVGVSPKRWSDLLVQTVQATVADDPAFATLPNPSLVGTRELERQLGVLLKKLPGKLAALAPDQVATQLFDPIALTDDSQHATPLVDLALAEEVSETSRIGCHPGDTVSVGIDVTGDGKVDVTVSGSVYWMPIATAARLTDLLGGETIKAGDFLDGDPAKSVRLVRALARIGAVRVQDH